MKVQVGLDAEAGVRREQLAGGPLVLARHDPGATWCRLRLVVRTGSLDECADEMSGIAHFIEHCGFRGTRSHENGELQRLFESIGARFGADLNAKTGLTETIWKLDVPTGKADRGKLTSALNVMGEWAHAIRFSEADVEAERAVILEEYRMKRGSAQRVKNEFWSRVFPVVGKRMPIGTLDTIQSITREQLVAFYESHYTYDRMALIAVGNLEAIGEEEGLLRWAEEADLFPRKAGEAAPGSPLPPPPPPPPPRLDPQHGALPQAFCVIPEQAMTSTHLCVELYQEVVASDPSAFMRHEILKRVFTSVLEARFRELSARPGSQQDSEQQSPWVSAGVACRLALNDPPTECTTVSAQCHRPCKDTAEAEEAQVLAAVRTLVRELVRLDAHGVAAQEVEFAKRKWQRVFERKLRPALSRDELCSELCEELVEYVSLGERVPVLGHHKEAEHALRLLAPAATGGTESISAEDLSGLARELLGPLISHSGGREEGAPWTAVAVVLQGLHCGNLDDAKLAGLVQGVIAEFRGADTLQPWVFHAPLDSVEDIGRALLAHVPEAARRQGTTNASGVQAFDMAETGATTLVLSNGMRVCFKDTGAFHPQKLSFQAFALGGSLNLNEVEDAAFGLLSCVLPGSGLGLLDDLSLSKLESSQQASVRFQHHWFHRGLGGSCASDKLEVLLQMIVAWLHGGERRQDGSLSPQRLDEGAFQRYLRIAVDGLRNSECSNAQEVQYAEQVRKTLIGEAEPALRPQRGEVLEQVTCELLADLYFDAFARDPTEFTFVFCGDLSAFDREELASLLDGYLGTLLCSSNAGPSKRWPEAGCAPRPVKLAFPDAEHRHLFQRARDADGAGEDDDKAQVLIAHRVLDGWSPAHALDTDLDIRIACMVAQIALLDELRTRRQLVYSVGVEQTRNSVAPFSLVFTSMSCSSCRAEEVIDSVYAQLDRLKTSEAQSELAEAKNGVRAQLLEAHQGATQNNSYWLFWLLDAWKRRRVEDLVGGAGPEAAACAWTDANAAQIAAPERYAARVDAALARLEHTFGRHFTDRVAVAMLKPAQTHL